LALIVLAYGVRALVVAGVLKRARIAPSVQLAITNPVQFAKSHVTGGIGAIVLVDPASGLPRIQTLVAGSPAQKAGLQGGDLIVEVDGVATRGRSLNQNIECIRGIASVGVALTIQRGGTNLNCVIHRSSWSGMGIVQQ
jgi:S1-C subfamily serine protease